jgi:hypothetical protein
VRRAFLVILCACGSKEPPVVTAPAPVVVASVDASAPAIEDRPDASSSSSAPSGLPDPSPDLLQVMSHARPSLSVCYELSLGIDPLSRGTFVVRFVVENDGTVSSAKADEITGNLVPQVIPCVLARLKKLRFAPHSGNPTDVIQPLRFEPTNDAGP